MMSGYDFDAYVHSIARRQPRRLPACNFYLSYVKLNAVMRAMHYDFRSF